GGRGGWAGGGGRVLVGRWATSTGEGVELSRQAAEVGAKAVFVTPPIYGVVTAESLRHHYGALAAIGMPVMVQDALISVAPGQVVRLAEEFSTVCYVKEEAPLEAGQRITELKRVRPGLNVLSGGAGLLGGLGAGGPA